MTSSNTNEFEYGSKGKITKTAIPHKKMKKSSSEYNLTSMVGNKQGQKVKEFEIIKEIGRGAYGTVFLAKSDKTGKKVALKVLDKMFLSKVTYIFIFIRIKKEMKL